MDRLPFFLRSGNFRTDPLSAKVSAATIPDRSEVE